MMSDPPPLGALPRRISAVALSVALVVTSVLIWVSPKPGDPLPPADASSDADGAQPDEAPSIADLQAQIADALEAQRLREQHAKELTAQVAVLERQLTSMNNQPRTFHTVPVTVTRGRTEIVHEPEHYPRCSDFEYRAGCPGGIPEGPDGSLRLGRCAWWIQR